EPADRIVYSSRVVVADHPPVGVGHGDQPAMIRTAGHFAVSILHLRRARRIHSPGVRLIFARELAQAIKGPRNLVHYRTASRGVITGEEQRPPSSVVGRLQTPDAPVYPSPQSRDDMGGPAAEHVVAVAVSASVAIGLG